jgi:hypothetical protein
VNYRYQKLSADQQGVCFASNVRQPAFKSLVNKVDKKERKKELKAFFFYKAHWHF